MNQVFDWKRWFLLVGKHWSENSKKYLLSLVAMAGLLLIWYTFLFLVNDSRVLTDDVQYVTYFTGLFLVGCLYGSLLFGDLAGGSKAIHHLLVPASTLEKLLCGLLYGMLLFYACYTVIFYLVDIPMVQLANNLAADRWGKIPGTGSFHQQEVVNIFKNKNPNDPGFMTWYLLLIYIAVQAAFILGSVYFPKYSFIKTSVSLLLVFLFIMLYIGKGLVPLTPAGGLHDNLTSFRLLDKYGSEVNREILIPGWIITGLEYILKFAFAPLFWVVTYFRLKEKEI